eukprot:s2730_g4.t1
MPQSEYCNEPLSLWICQDTPVTRAKFGLPLEEDIRLLTGAVANKKLLEAEVFGSRTKFLKSWVTMPIGIQESFRVLGILGSEETVRTVGIVGTSLIEQKTFGLGTP